MSLTNHIPMSQRKAFTAFGGQPSSYAASSENTSLHSSANPGKSAAAAFFTCAIHRPRGDSAANTGSECTAIGSGRSGSWLPASVPTDVTNCRPTSHPPAAAAATNMAHPMKWRRRSWIDTARNMPCRRRARKCRFSASASLLAHSHLRLVRTHPEAQNPDPCRDYAAHSGSAGKASEPNWSRAECPDHRWRGHFARRHSSAGRTRFPPDSGCLRLQILRGGSGITRSSTCPGRGA